MEVASNEQFVSCEQFLWSQKNPSPLSKHEAWILIDTLSKVFREFSCRFVYEGLARVSEPTI